MRPAMLFFAVFLKLLSSDSQPNKYREKAPAWELPALSAMKCGRKKPDFAEYQEIRADKSHQEENNNGKKL